MHVLVHACEWVLCHAHEEMRGQLWGGSFLLHHVGVGALTQACDKPLPWAVSLAWGVVLRKRIFLSWRVLEMGRSKSVLAGHTQSGMLMPSWLG